jgi:hypothetical protein
MAQKASYRQQLLTVQQAAQTLGNPTLWDAAHTLAEVEQLEDAVKIEQNPQKVEEILTRLFASP